ncbi:PAS domain S-box-containing protein [Cnuella takakiae]|uniref:histidine kinase n=1 Tax=Cnuella takakiae TaxID=1302690 RepID=A0A1M4T0U8_9BACT|nr:PAS domain S-box protein [Cnuella takakiae]OLY90653.1 hypothetical protein BUE76_01100 [Cnuella takakiae]SHE38122.1 PAS domain S-box-containing protein [Cnuella takakiae]
MKPISGQPLHTHQGSSIAFGEQVLYTIMDEALQPQLLLSPANSILYPNQAFCSLAGCTTQEAIGQELATFQQGMWQELTPAGGTPRQITIQHQTYLISLRAIPGTGDGKDLVLVSLVAQQSQPAPINDAARAQKMASSLFEASPDCLKILDLDGCLLDMNTCGRALMEVDDFNQLYGSYWPGLWGSHQQQAQEAVNKARKGGISRFSAPCATVKGTLKYWDVLVTPVFGADGTVLQLIASSRDITKEQATRTALHRTEELAKSLFEQSPDCLKLLDLEGKLIALNASGRNLLESNGVGQELQWVDMWQGGDKPTVLAAMQTAARGGISHFTAPCTLPSGQEFWWEVMLTPVRNEKGTVYQMIAACRDITSRKALEQQLANSALQKELALQAASLGTWSFDFGSDEMGLDERARELFGVQPGQKLSHSELFALVHPDDRPHLQQVIATDIQTKNAVSHVEYRLHPDTGTNKWVHVCRRLFFDEHGNPVHCVGLFQDITQQKETELRLRKINQTLQLGIQVGKLAIAEVDYITGQVSLSPEAASLYGFAAGTRQVSREQVHASFHTADKDRIFRMMRACLDPAGPGFMDLEHRVVAPDGAVRWLSVRKQVFFDTGSAQARPQYAIIAAQDITAQKEAANRIQESEARFKAIFNGAPVAIWEEDFSKGMQLLEELKEKGVLNFGHYCSQHPEVIPAFLSKLEVHDVNEAAVQLFGATSKADLIGRLDQTFLPDSLEVFTQELIALASKQAYYKGEARMQTLQGQPIWVLLSVRFPQGTDFSSVLVTMTDITVQKKLEAEVGAHAGRIQQILDALPQKAWISNPDGAMEYFSEQWYTYTGLDKTGSLGLAWQGAIHPQDLPKLTGTFAQARATQESWEMQLRLRNYAGSYRWHLARAMVLKSGGGAISSWVGTSTDIHDQRTAADLLEQAVAERTQALQTANKALQQTNKELEEFLYVASHDLQEPVRKILTFSNLLQERGQGFLTPQLVNYLQRIDASAQRMTSLIKSILDFSSLRSSLPATACNLDLVLQNVLQELSWYLEQEGAMVTVHNLPEVLAIQHEVKQLFYNLIANSLKFRKQAASPHITITASELSEAQAAALSLPLTYQQYAHIQVTDNGIGFHPQYAEKIFEIFQRLHNRSTYDGAGIGLALCRKIAIRSGGHIWAEGTDLEGAVFHVVLPLALQVERG